MTTMIRKIGTKTAAAEEERATPAASLRTSQKVPTKAVSQRHSVMPGAEADSTHTPPF